MSISNRIQKLRKDRNLSQAMLAELAGLKPPAISQYESGARSPNFESLIKLSNALGVPSDYLLMGEDTPHYEEVEDSLIKLITHIAGMLPFDKREMLLDYSIMLLKSGNTMVTLPYFSDVRSYADYMFRSICASILPVDLDQVLAHLNVSITKANLDDCEGMIIKGKENMIILDPRFENPQRRRFTIATLLGHLILPWHTDTIYHGRVESSFKTEDALEMEALQFAACLLMPRDVLAQDLSVATVSLDALRKLAGEKYNVSVFSLANSLVEMYPDKFAVIQSDGREILKTFQGSRPLKDDLDTRTLAAGFMRSQPKETEMRTAKMEENVWFQNSKAGAYVLEESIYDPKIGKILTLLTIL